MRPGWPRLALRSRVRGGPAWPYFRLRWPHYEWPEVSKLLIQSHLVSFSLISYRRRWERGLAPKLGEPLRLERPSGVRRSGKLLIRFRLVPFRSISNRLREQGMRGPALGELLHSLCPRPQCLHPMLRIDLLSGVAGSGGTFNSVAFSCIWLHFLSSMPALGAGDARFPTSRERRWDSPQRRM